MLPSGEAPSSCESYRKTAVGEWPTTTQDRWQMKEQSIEMTRIEQSVVIGRPVEEVFRSTADVDRMSEWSAELVETKKTSEGLVGVGTTFSAVVKFLGRRVEAEQEVTAYEPNRRFNVLVASGPVGGRAAILSAPSMVARK